MQDKARLIQQLDEARAQLYAALENLDVETEVYPGWTIKHVLAHLAGWDDAVIAALRAHAGGERPGTPADQGIDVYNAQSVATRQGLDYDRVAKECRLAREELKLVIEDLPPEKLEEPILFPWGPVGPLSTLIRIFTEHEEEHAREIQALDR